MFRISVFDHAGVYRPIWKGVKRARHELTIIAWDSHFHGIRNVASLFGVRHYCIDCEKPYAERREHAIFCRQKCRNCCGMGFG
jgi:hypothetical protein